MVVKTDVLRADSVEDLETQVNGYTNQLVARGLKSTRSYAYHRAGAHDNYMAFIEYEVPDQVPVPERVRENPSEFGLSISKHVRATEEDLIKRALAETGGNRTRAANLLGISHRALLYKLKDYKMQG